MDRLRIVLIGLVVVAVVALVVMVASGGGDEGSTRESDSSAREAPGESSAGIDASDKQGTSETPSDTPANFGSTAKGAERSEIVNMMRAYFTALGEGDLNTACSYFPPQVLAGLKRVTQQLPEKQRPKSGCAALGYLLNEPPDRSVAQVAEEGANAEVLRIGIDGATAIVLLDTGDDEQGYFTLNRLGGEWKVASPGIVSLTS